jgi:predicted phage terminase large subunit-like protein
MSECADFTAITVAYISEGICTVLLVDRGRWHYEVIRDKAASLIQQFGSNVQFIVELANVGESLCAYLKERAIRVHPYRPMDSKLGRAARMLPEFECGRVHLLRRDGKDSWITPLINEFVSFPGCRYDDQVDSLIQMVYFAKSRPYPSGRVFFC